MTLHDLLTSQFEDMLKRKRLGSGWSITKEQIIELAKIHGLEVTRREIAKAVKQLPYSFLMKKTTGYAFPENQREWKDYTTRKEKLGRGLIREAIDEASYNFQEFKNQLQ